LGKTESTKTTFLFSIENLDCFQSTVPLISEDLQSVGISPEAVSFEVFLHQRKSALGRDVVRLLLHLELLTGVSAPAYSSE
jgi:hypothetical protein